MMYVCGMYLLISNVKVLTARLTLVGISAIFDSIDASIENPIVD